MKIECLILESPTADRRRITVTVNELIRSSCGQLGWLNREEIGIENGIRDAYIAAISARPDLPVISKINQVFFKDSHHIFYYLFEYHQDELERAYARLTRRNNKAQHRSNVRSVDLQTSPN